MLSYIGSSWVFFATHFLLIAQKMIIKSTKIAPERTSIIIIISKVFPESDSSVLLKPVRNSWVSLIIDQNNYYYVREDLGTYNK